MDTRKKVKIQQILNAFETGSAQGNYGAISVFKDAPGNRIQYTIGRSQTTESGFLKTLLQKYVDNKGLYADEMKPFVARIKPHSGSGTYNSSIYPDKKFEALIKKSANDPIMRQTQDDFFDEKYWNPAFAFFQKHGFKTPLAMLTIYDTAIHSGPALDSPRSMMSVLRKRFAEKTPANGGDEKKWISEYVNARHSWLANHSSRPILRKTTYRTQTIKNLIKSGNWDLNGDIRTGNGVSIKDSAIKSQQIEPVQPKPVQPVKAQLLSVWAKLKKFFFG